MYIWYDNQISCIQDVRYLEYYWQIVKYQSLGTFFSNFRALSFSKNAHTSESNKYNPEPQLSAILLYLMWPPGDNRGGVHQRSRFYSQIFPSNMEAIYNKRVTLAQQSVMQHILSHLSNMHVPNVISCLAISDEGETSIH